MRWAPKISLRRKITLVIMINTVAALCAAGIAFAEYGVQRFRQVGLQDLNALAQILGTNCTAPLIFGDPNSAREILQALTVKPHIVAAAVYDRDDKPFAIYRQNPASDPKFPPPLDDSLSRFTSGHLLIFQPIVFEGEKVGTVLLEGDRGEERLLLLRYLYFFGIIVVAVSLGAFVMAGRLQNPISNPILDYENGNQFEGLFHPRGETLPGRSRCPYRWLQRDAGADSETRHRIAPCQRGSGAARG